VVCIASGKDSAERECTPKISNAVVATDKPIHFQVFIKLTIYYLSSPIPGSLPGKLTDTIGDPHIEALFLETEVRLEP
jgi:hypothetical protein